MVSVAPWIEKPNKCWIMKASKILKYCIHSRIHQYSTRSDSSHVIKNMRARINNMKKYQHLNAMIARYSDDILLEMSKKFNQVPQNQNFYNLRGITVAVKDNICTKDFPTTCASEILRDYKPPEDAACIELLKESGCLITGKTNMDEFGMGIFGACMNPRYPHKVSGGSSGGSAAAVGADMCDVALGSDTGGSVRLPAAYCNIHGFKPSYGLISRRGLISYASSLDTIGILGKDLDIIKNVFKCLNKFDERDPTSLPSDYRVNAEKYPTDPKPRIGIPVEYIPEDMDELVEKLFENFIQKLQGSGYEVVPVSLAHTKYALPAYYIISSAEASSNLSRYGGLKFEMKNQYEYSKKWNREMTIRRSQKLGLEVRKRILLGTHLLSAETYHSYFVKAQKIRRLVKNDFDSVFDSKVGVDFILTPVYSNGSATLEVAKSASQNNISDYLNDILTVPASLAGLPSLSMSTKLDDIDFSIQIIGPYCSDLGVLNIAKKLKYLG